MNIEETIKNLEKDKGRTLTEKERQAIERMGLLLDAIWEKEDEKETTKESR